MTQSLLEQYAAELMRISERDAKKPKTSQGGNGFWKKEWTEDDKRIFRGEVDRLCVEVRGTTHLNLQCSSEHVANIVYRQHWRGQIPDDCWAYLVGRVEYWQEVLPDEDEMFERANLNDLWERWHVEKKKAAHWRHRSRVQSRVKRKEDGEVA